MNIKTIGIIVIVLLLAVFLMRKKLGIKLTKKDKQNGSNSPLIGVRPNVCRPGETWDPITRQCVHPYNPNIPIYHG